MLVSSDKCYGCMSCVQACAYGCIEIIENKEGFWEPALNKETCINCKKCERSCPALCYMSENLKENIVTKASWSKSAKTIQRSSSGGVFFELALKIIENQGVVFGAEMDERINVHHTPIFQKKDLKKIQASKYVQSDIGETYKIAKVYLLKGNLVLFSGTPCQIAGLYSYLGCEYDNLYTVDFICHGVPSPGVLRKYISYKENKKRKKISKYEMRSKKRGWSSIFSSCLKYDDGTEEYIQNSYNDPFMNGFLNNLILRNACYSCEFAQIKRVADITLGDFWGIGKQIKFDYKTSQGISIVMLNSQKGMDLFAKCESNCISVERRLEEAIVGQPMLVPHTFMNEQRESFFKDYQRFGFDDLQKKYLRNKPSYIQRVKIQIRSFVGYDNVRMIKSLFRGCK